MKSYGLGGRAVGCLLLLWAAQACSCGSGGGKRDAGDEPHAVRGDGDAGILVTPQTDGGPSTDRPMDAGRDSMGDEPVGPDTPDTGDAATPDAGMDAGTTDAASDAGTPDTGTVEPDAGSPPGEELVCPRPGAPPECAGPTAYHRRITGPYVNRGPDGLDVEHDAEGNTLVLFETDGNLSVDAGGGILAHDDGAEGGLIAKYDACGTHLWSELYAASFSAIAVDDGGHLVAVGRLARRDPLLGLERPEDYEIVVARFSPCGDVLWAHGFGGEGTQEGIDVAVDEARNVYVVANFQARASVFGEEFTATRGGLLVKLDSDGAHEWTRAYDGDGFTYMEAVAFQQGEGLYAVGTFDDTLPLGTDAALTAELNDAFVVKYDAAGEVLWGAPFGGPGNQDARGIASDASGIVLAGDFGGTFASGDAMLDAGGQINLFLHSLSHDGTPSWAVGFASNAIDITPGFIDRAPNGDVLVTRYFWNDTTVGDQILSAPARAALLSRFDASGSHLGSEAFPDIDRLAVGMAPDGSLVLAGKGPATAELGAEPSVGEAGFLVRRLPDATSFAAPQAFPLDQPRPPSEDPRADDLAICAGAGLPGPYVVTEGSLLDDTAAAVTAAQDGSAYVAWGFADDVVLEEGATAPTPGTLVVSRQGPDGAREWMVPVGGAGLDLALDPDGNLVMAGQLRGTVYTGGQRLASHGESDWFVAKLNCRGEAIWARRFGSAYYDVAEAVGVGDDGHIYVAGYMTRAIELGDEVLEIGDGTRVVLMELDPDGTLLDYALYYASTRASFQSLEVSSSGALILAADNSATGLDLGGGVISGPFVAALDTDFGYLWHLSYALPTRWHRPQAVPVGDEVHFAALGDALMDFGFGSMATSSLVFGVIDDGGTLTSIQEPTNTAAIAPWSLARDASGNRLVSGPLLRTATFGDETYTGGSGAAIFAGFDSSGAPIWSRFLPGGQAHGVAATPDGRVLACGRYNPATDLGAGPESTIDRADGFVLAEDLP